MLQRGRHTWVSIQLHYVNNCLSVAICSSLVFEAGHYGTCLIGWLIQNKSCLCGVPSTALAHGICPINAAFLPFE